MHARQPHACSVTIPSPAHSLLNTSYEKFQPSDITKITLFKVQCLSYLSIHQTVFGIDLQMTDHFFCFDISYLQSKLLFYRCYRTR